MDFEVRQSLCAAIEKLTHSGAPALDKELLRTVKATCKQNDAYIRAAYEAVLHDLAEKHAEVRLSAFQLASELFSRSHLFRELLTTDFKKFSILVTGTNPKHPLPPPKDAAARLKKSSLLAIKEWTQKYGHGYPKLKLGFNYLKFNRKVDFEVLVSRDEAERRRREEREGRQRTILQQRIQEVKQEMVDLRRDIDSCITEVEACFNLLLPRFDLPDIYTSASVQSDSQDRSSNQDNTVQSDSQDKSSFQDSSDSQDRISCQDSNSIKDRSIEDNSTTQNSLSVNQDKSITHINSQDKSNNSSQDTTNSQGTDNSNQDSSTIQDSTSIQDSKTIQGSSLGRTLSSAGSFVSLSEGSGSEIEGEAEEVWHDSVEVAGPSSGPACNVDPESDSDSEVEWEEVEAIGEEEAGVGGWEADMQEHGLAGRGLSIPVQLSKCVEVRETEDNSSILVTLKERKKQLQHHLMPSLNKCLEWMTKAGEGECVRTAIDMKDKIFGVLSKYNRLNIIFRNPVASEDEEAPEVQPDTKKRKIVETETEWKFGTDVPESIPNADLALDPTTPQAQLAILKKKLKAPPANSEHALSGEAGQGSGTSSDLKSRAPVVPFGMDLYHWENSSTKIEPRTLAPVGSLHRFWAQETEVNISNDEQERLKCRTISFPGKFQPVAKSCRALLPSGKLCPRKDRYKCPFHGPIIPRDEHGNPVDTGAATAGGTPAQLSLLGGAGVEGEEQPLWEDPELQREIMAATGAELNSTKGKKKDGRKGKRKMKDKYPGLTDLDAVVDTPRKRLERRVLNKRSLKRVTESINKLASKKYNDKFGDSFHYALKS